MAITACLHPNQTPLTLIACVKSQILSSVLTASSSLLISLFPVAFCEEDLLSMHNTSVVELSLGPCPRLAKGRGKAYHNVQTSPFSNCSFYQCLNVCFGRNITFDRLTFRRWVLLVDILSSVSCGWFVDIGDVKECSFRCELKSCF